MGRHLGRHAELTIAIEYALQDILRRISAGSAVAVVSTERGTKDRLYRGKFMPVDWDGYLECFALPYELDEEPMWEGGRILADRALSGLLKDDWPRTLEELERRLPDRVP